MLPNESVFRGSTVYTRTQPIMFVTHNYCLSPHQTLEEGRGTVWARRSPDPTVVVAICSPVPAARWPDCRRRESGTLSHTVGDIHTH